MREILKPPGYRPRDFAQGRRESRHRRGSRRRLVRLPAQLPDAPQARPAGDEGGLEAAERQREAAERAAVEAAARSEETATLLGKTVLTIQHPAGEDGRLFGSVTNAEIDEARGLRIDRKRIRLDEPIREVGTYLVEVEVPGGTVAKVKTIVAEAK